MRRRSRAPTGLKAADPKCPDCGGSGWAVKDDGGAGAASVCRCRLSELALLNLELQEVVDKLDGVDKPPEPTQLKILADPVPDVLLFKVPGKP